MRALVLIIFAWLLLAPADAQTRLRRPCPASTTPASVEVERDGDLAFKPCALRSSFFNGSLKLLDAGYAPLLAASNYLSIGTNSRFSVPSANHFTAAEFNYPLTLSGTNKYYVGSRLSLDVQGTVTNPSIFGSWVHLLSNSLNTAGTGSIYGTYSSVDVGGPVNEAFGGYFGVLSGGAGASGAGTLTGVLGVVGMAHNASTTNAFAGDFWLQSSTSDPSVVTTAAAVRARASLQLGVKATTLRGVSIGDFVMNGGEIENSVGLFIDSTIDVGTASKYAIRSLSTSPSALAGDVYISDATKGIILRSPDGTCYRFTAANGGTLNAGAAVNCP